MTRHLLVALVVALPATLSFAPAPLVRTEPLRARRHAVAPLAPRPAVSRAAVVAQSSASTPARPQFLASIARAAVLCLGSMMALILSSARLAFAAERTLRRAAPAAGIAISGDMIKYGFVGACIGASYFFRREETPILRETEGAAVVDLDTLKPPAEPEGAPEPAIDALDAPEAAEEEAPFEAPLVMDDTALFGSLQARMQSLTAEPSDEAPTDDAAPADDAPADSTDGWGEGSTAVLEPPREDEGPRGVLDGDSPLNFPPGYPLIDGEVTEAREEAEVTPAASADQIAMLNRMMGNAE